jgi:RNA polymerase sigma-B factor
VRDPGIADLHPGLQHERHAPGTEGDDRAMARLFRRARAGDTAARETLIERFLPLARSLARRYIRSSESADDLVQVASLALVKAVDRFDPDRDVAFSTFAVPTILGELKRHFRDTAWAVHMPRSLSEGALRVEKTERQLANRTGHRPSVAEIAEAMGEELEWVVNVLDASRAHDALSLDATVDTPDGDGETLAGTLGDEDERFDYVEERDAVAGCIGDLSERERTVLELRFGAELTQSEIAERIGVSQMQVSRILRRTLERLRELAEEPADTSAEDASSAEVGITVPLNGRRPRPRRSAAAAARPGRRP